MKARKRSFDGRFATAQKALSADEAHAAKQLELAARRADSSQRGGTVRLHPLFTACHAVRISLPEKPGGVAMPSRPKFPTPLIRKNKGTKPLSCMLRRWSKPTPSFQVENPRKLTWLA